MEISLTGLITIGLGIVIIAGMILLAIGVFDIENPFGDFDIVKTVGACVYFILIVVGCCYVASIHNDLSTQIAPPHVKVEVVLGKPVKMVQPKDVVIDVDTTRIVSPLSKNEVDSSLDDHIIYLNGEKVTPESLAEYNIDPEVTITPIKNLRYAMTALGLIDVYKDIIKEDDHSYRIDLTGTPTNTK